MVRTVPGRTDRVVVVGAGLAGLATALRLRGAGREVTVVERGRRPRRPRRPRRAARATPSTPGRRSSPPRRCVADTLAAVGEKLEDRLTLVPLETTYRAQYADGIAPGRARRPRRLRRRGRAPCAARPRPTALRRYLADLAELYRLQLAHLHRPQPRLPAGPARPRAGGPRPPRRVRPAVPARRAVLRRRPAAPAVQLPGALRRGLAVPGDRRLRRHRPARHRRRRLAPDGRHRRRARRAGRRRRRRRRRLPLRRRRRPGWRRRDGGSPRCGWPTATGSPPTPSSSPPTSPGSSCPGLRAAAPPGYSPSCVALHVGVRAELPGQAHHTISFGALLAAGSSTS